MPTTAELKPTKRAERRAYLTRDKAKRRLRGAERISAPSKREMLSMIIDEMIDRADVN